MLPPNKIIKYLLQSCIIQVFLIQSKFYYFQNTFLEIIVQLQTKGKFFFFQKEGDYVLLASNKKGEKQLFCEKNSFVTDPNNFLRTFLDQKCFWKGWQNSLEQQHITISLKKERNGNHNVTFLLRMNVKQIEKKNLKILFSEKHTHTTLACLFTSDFKHSLQQSRNNCNYLLRNCQEQLKVLFCFVSVLRQLIKLKIKLKKRKRE